MRRLCARDAAAADLIGTILTLGVTITLIASVSLMLLQTRTAEVDPLEVSGLPAATVGATNLTVLHLGGDSAPPDRLRGIVLVNGTVWYDGPPVLPQPLWRLGDRLELGPFPQPLPADASIELTLVDTGAGATLLAESLRLGSGATGAAGSGWPAPTVTVRFENGLASTSASMGATLQLEARVAYAGGRGRLAEVIADVRALGGGSRVELRDDGTGGDTVAHDGVYSTTLRVPEQFPTGTYVITVTATARDGATGTGTGTVQVEQSSGFYNTAVMLAAGHRILSYDNPSGSHDKISTHVKLRFNTTSVDADGLYKDVDGKKYNLTNVNVWYDPLKPGGSNSGNDCTASNAPCIPLAVLCSTTHVRAFRADNATISHFQRERDTFRYYLELVWMEKNGSNVFRETIEASETAVWFFLRANADSKVVKHDGWPSEFTNCTG